MEDKSLWAEDSPKKSELLVKYGFIKKDEQGKYFYNEEKNIFEPIEGEKLSTGDADEEEIEVIKEKYGKTGYPSPLKIYRLSWEIQDLSLEESYFWVIDALKENFPILDKLEDSFAAAENSAFFGVTQQKLSAQQDRVTQYLASSGKMIKELFQMVREMRILDEKLGYYRKIEEELKKDEAKKRDKGADVTLKGFFVDLVQGGGKSSTSVFGMARDLDFITLPDLFFDAPPLRNDAEIKNHIESLQKDFNQNVLRVLHRHLYQYNTWRISTHKEHENRRRFLLHYLLQHFQIIKMYLEWTKPYLKHVARLGMKESNLRSADIVSAFEGSMLDIEVMARNPSEGANSCVLATFNYRTRPEMKVIQDGYQRGPVHIGKILLTLRAYAWTDKQIEEYKRMKDKEIMMLIADVSGSVVGAMEALGDELDRYILEAKGETKKEETSDKPKKKKSITETLFGDFYTPKQNKKSTKSQKVIKAEKATLKAALEKSGKPAKDAAWNTYHNFKKAHGMITW